MTVSEWLGWLGVFAAGLGLGGWLYGGLWWTVKRLPGVRNPAWWMLASFVLRFGVALLGLYFLMAGDWRRLVLATAGMWVGRVLVVRGVRHERAIQS